MRRIFGVVFRPAIIAACLAGGRAVAADSAGVQLTPTAAIAPDLAAFPRIEAAPDEAAARINHALAAADDRSRAFVKDCAAQEGEDPTSVTRTIMVTMRGPRYLSFVANDSFDCHGAHPDTDTVALVYDLKTGAPVNWGAVLPATLAGKARLDEAGDGTRIGMTSSPVLQRLYLKGHEIDPDCIEPLSEPGLEFILWPDAEQGGLAIQPASLPHVVAACGDRATIPLARLRQLGVKTGLIDAIQTAHDQHLYEPAPH
jgi:hypothetical protein